MGLQVVLDHSTEYRYDKPVSLGPQLIQLRPAPHSRTPILSYSLTLTPSEHILNWQLDPHSNYAARVLILQKTSEFEVQVQLVADLAPINPFNFFLEPGFEDYPFQYSPQLAKDLEPYRSTERAGPRLQSFLASVSREKRGTIDFLVDLSRRVRDEVDYVTRLEPGVQSCEQTLELRSGSCRDSAWLFVQILRQLGIAARFVSGYLIQLASDEPQDSIAPRNDSADLHAWVEAFLPGAGWIGMDATSGLFAGEGHIPLVCTPTASQAAPIGGTVEPSKVEFSNSISVRRLNDAPRTSQPFSEDDWSRLQLVARQIDEDLEEHDVRLTMGGEPTFVGIDEPESLQWNIEALGQAKRNRGMALIRGLRERMTAGALLHYGQGKWYPGEPLPRWSLGCYWRRDGVAVWENIDFIAREDQDRGFGSSDALRFAAALGRRLQVSSGNTLPAFNPENITSEPAGYVLPLRRRQKDSGELFWSTQLWFTCLGHLLLLSPGDSPMGYRIPTESMPWVAPDDVKYAYEASGDLVELPQRHIHRTDLFDQEPEPDTLPPLSSSPEDAAELIRPALCVEARNGRLHVFLPYTRLLADYLELLAAVEDTCEYLHKPVWLEGYAPPDDPRLQSFTITPDPGVLEVNLPATGKWDELVQINRLVFEEARRNRLTAEKFDYNGSHIATGGGSHIVIGGATVSDSPILRRPDLLRSMVTFWQNHPSLSYLFSGMYVGPTSQHPRVDEARLDTLYELEVAFSQLSTGDCPPSVLDGLFRNLLVDVTGNFHRAEFCIDKLYPLPGRGRRLGLLELRAFEMAPHVRMNMANALLVRALIASFWKQPFQGRLVRWGASLHDRFMLPDVVKRDFSEVLGHLCQSGYQIEEKWFASHFEFRFPKIGSIAADGIELEFRRALEPWNVLAEETISGRTFRSVDSSLERLQVKISGATTESRYVVACSGRKVPLQATNVSGEAIAGVRYRARRLSEELHPTVPVHAPLIFDIIDSWQHRSIGRCAYHVTSPTRGLYSTRPVNAGEAENRRAERFQKLNPQPSSISPPDDETNPLFPMTLDLRWPAPAPSTVNAEPVR